MGVIKGVFLVLSHNIKNSNLNIIIIIIKYIATCVITIKPALFSFTLDGKVFSILFRYLSSEMKKTYTNRAMGKITISAFQIVTKPSIIIILNS
jgi:hypothetical protein